MDEARHSPVTGCAPGLPTDDLRIDVRRSVDRSGSSWVEVVVSGELDDTGAAALTAAWGVELTLLPARVHLDLGRVDFCNAAGLHSLGGVLASTRQQQIGVQVLVQPRLAWLVHLVGLDPEGRVEVVETTGRCAARTGDRGPAGRS